MKCCGVPFRPKWLNYALLIISITMHESFFDYLQRLELMAFFSAYPLVYAIVSFFAGNKPSKHNLKGKLFFLLPYSYALVGTLYLGFQLKNMYPEFPMLNLLEYIRPPWLMLWGLLSMLFWIPALSKRPMVSLLHSFVFLFILIKDLFFRLPRFAPDMTIVRNDMKLYTGSLLINVGTLIVVALIYYLTRRYKVKKDSSVV